MVSFKPKKRLETKSLLTPRMTRSRSGCGGGSDRNRRGEPRSDDDDDYLEGHKKRVVKSPNEVQTTPRSTLAKLLSSYNKDPRSIQTALTSTSTTTVSDKSNPTTGSFMGGGGGPTVTPPLTPDSDDSDDDSDDDLISGRRFATSTDPPGNKLIAASDSTSLVQNLLCMMDKACVAPAQALEGEWGSSSDPTAASGAAGATSANTTTFNSSRWTNPATTIMGRNAPEHDLKSLYYLSQQQKDQGDVSSSSSSSLEEQSSQEREPPEVITKELPNVSPKFRHSLEPQKGEKHESFEVVLREKTPPRRKKQLGKGLIALLHHIPHPHRSHNSAEPASSSLQPNSKTKTPAGTQQTQNQNNTTTRASDMLRKPRRRIHRDTEGRILKPLTAVSDRIPIEEEKKEEERGIGVNTGNNMGVNLTSNSIYNSIPRTINAPPITRNLAKEARYKQVLGSWMNTRTPLETITEDDHNRPNSPLASSSSPAVRVPGIQNPDNFLSQSDLIGDEVPSTPKRHQVVESMDPQPSATQLHKARSWIGMGKWLGFGGLMEEGDDDIDNNSNNNHQETNETLMARKLSRMRSAPGNLTPQSSSLSAITTTNNNTNMNVQRLWKASVCPNSGRTYYYHRVTRRATWSKPPDEELILPKNSLAAVNADHHHAGAEPTLSSQLFSVPEEDEIKQVRYPVLSKETERVLLIKHDILEILHNMGEDRNSVDKLLAQYEGREEELLGKLRLSVQDRPFDEAIMTRSTSADGACSLISVLGTVADKSTEISGSSSRSYQGRSHTQSSFVSGFTGYSSALMSASTQPIRNTGGAPVQTQTADMSSHATSISSRQGDMLPPAAGAPHPQKNNQQYRHRVPSNIPVPRTRDLLVEEFNYKRDDRREKGVIRTTQPKPPVPEIVDPIAYFGGDNEDTDTKETDSLKNDSISALSEAELSYTNMDVQRRRALDDAIAKEDWDLAAMLSDGLRTNKWKPEKNHEWTPTELDRFISSNDWDAVANYIAQLRALATSNSSNDNTTGRSQKVNNNKAIGHNGHKPQKRFGAKSQLQHKNVLHRKSVTVPNDSWESASCSSYEESEYSSSSSTSTYEEILSGRKTRKGNNFAC